MIEKSTLKFLFDLSQNNNKEWFHDNQKEYKALKENILAFTAEFITKFGSIDHTIAELEPKKCLFRINRDIRFSKNKDPYKTNIGISIAKGGKKTDNAGYYINIQPNSSFIGGGQYMVPPNDLKKIRQEIDYSFADFKAILDDNSFKSYYGDLSVDPSMILKRPPKGYSEDNPAVEYLKYKSFTAIKNIPDSTVLSKDFIAECISGMTALKPLVDFLNREE
jgi:uncharacterized protein (TIGR02453 family)